MESGLDYTFEGSPGNYVKVTFNSVSFDMINGHNKYEYILSLHGVVVVHGYEGYITGYSSIYDLGTLIEGIKNDLKQQPQVCHLPIVEDEALAYATEFNDTSDHISIEFSDCWTAFLTGRISASADIETTYANMSFRFQLNLDILQDNICDLDTIHNILKDRYDSSVKGE